MAVEEYRRTYRCGLTRYDVQRDPVDHALDKVLPADLGPVHAVPIPPQDGRMLREPEFLDGWGYATALCGTTVKVLLPQSFDPGDEDSCRRCVGPSLRGGDAPSRRDDEPDADRDDQEQ
ncbi:hypothetical protein [Geodermatophilus telluris]|uniref:hypothetical protein n=1 Tax=Geodermatophilus telluris TaxID=1190417 RepID=UPI000B85E12D|nr:hypothetical protein [Geodermatophilus telluris]